MRKLIVLATLVSIVSGCYVGNTRGKKTAAYVVNGAILATGTALLVAGATDNESCDTGDATCSYSGTGRGAALLLGAGIASVGALGIGINVLVPTHDPEVDGVVYASAPIEGTITGPGLQPAAVTLR